MPKHLITIDGASATGKGTIAKIIAEKLGWSCFDTGAMYRCFAYYLMTHDLHHASEDAIMEALKHFDFEIQEGPDVRYYIEGQDVSKNIRSLEVSRLTSKLAVLLPIRQYMVKKQQDFAHDHHAVFEGRDMGSVVFPDAPLKVFLTASLDTRAQRRLDQFKSQNANFDLDIEVIKNQIQERDQRDSSREESPLVEPEGALIIDTSFLSIEEVCEAILSEWKQKSR